MLADIEFIDRCMDILEANDPETLIIVHNELKVFTPRCMDETTGDSIWCKAWWDCPDNILSNPDPGTIRKHDMLFCKLLMGRLRS
jgi:hypothetical protein